MTLDEFCEEMRRDLEAFQTDWVAKHQEQPEFYPLEMDGGDWHEQLLMSLWTKDKV